MIYLPLAAGVPFIMKLIAVIWVLTALLLIFIILIQKGKGGGLSGAFGGLGAGGLLGTRTGDFLTWVTIGLVIAFLGIGILMVKFYKPAEPAETPPTQTQPQPGDAATPAPSDTGETAAPEAGNGTTPPANTPPQGGTPPAENTPPADK